MTRDQIVNAMALTGIVPCWRYDDTSAIIEASKAMCDIGMNSVELTMTMPGTLRLIERAAAELPKGTLVGAGTVLDAETARMAILAGANYIVSPTLVPEVITMCHRYGVAAVAGAFSPTEILAAKTLGADVVKIYPAGLFGANQLAETLTVIPGIRTAASGGIALADTGRFITAGADMVVIGMPHIALPSYVDRTFTGMQRIGSRLLEIVREARDPAVRARMGAESLRRYTDLGDAKTAAAAR
ncbi:MAG: bifunctional 4-hydroxy-2-oxoglutarate aldolase/2-dehydro-3-deoxy-phosphogluconate aldolase [Planctomycetes bacterium]|nr:bifunctional 4-hydroxy-2-oxoglutarate aldolase/2-dehydro-3-deoxy-phosphogluconate aldolase [Planctomycetota bacterium]